MKAAWYQRTGPAREVLQLGELEIPRPGAGELLVRVFASGVNPSDTKMRAGWRGARIGFPLVVPHSDGAGEVVALGEGVDASRLNTRVWIYNATALYNASRAMGSAAQYCALPAAQAIALPAGADFMQGACFGVPACTAHRAVFSEGSVQGQTLLVQGGAGCVAHYAIQFAKLAGARVIATVSGAAKAAHARAAGADDTVDYTQQDVVARVLQLTQAQGVDRIIEVDLGANLAIDVPLIKVNGNIASYSSSAVPEPVFPYYPLAYKGVNLRLVQGFNLPREARDAALADITRWCEQGMLQHAIGAVFPLEQIAQAHESVEQRRVIGNVVLRID
jgi:NADPH2:quinone reductase